MLIDDSDNDDWAGFTRQVLYETQIPQGYSYTLGVLMNGIVKKALNIPWGKE